jgi:dTDP-glucose 4,6-dehydratase
MEVFEEDIKEIINNFEMSVFKDKTVLITGATGLIGKICTLSFLQSGTKVVALVRNREKAQKIFSDDKNFELLVQDINSPINTDRKVDYIIHCASTTSSSDFVQKPVETIYTALNGTRNVLEFAKRRGKYLEGMVYLSSLEVYGKTENEQIKEEDLGYIDILTPRSSYSEGKRMSETMCISYAQEYNVPVKIARLAQTFGAGVSKDDNRVFAQFAKSVINKENIILHTKGETKRNYCYTTDAVRGIFTILTKGEKNQAYNVANKNTYISIADMAKLLENENTKVVYEIDDKERGYNPTIKICLDSTKLEQLGWSPKIDLPKMFERTIADLKNSGNL